MLVGRSLFQALLLPDGDVLAISGGASNANYSTTISCDRFNLANQTWEPAPNLNESRLNFAAVLVSDKVFVFGGLNFKSGVNVTLSSVEVLPLADWVSVGQMASARSAHAATLLNNSRILICGGTQTGVAHEGIAASEMFDTRNLSWLPVPPMNQARAHHQAIRLLNGNVLVTGGAGPGGSGAGHYLSSCEIFDTASGVWINVASMNTPSAQHRLVLFDDGRVLRVGGSGGGSGTEICEIYDPVLNTWTLTGQLAVGRHSLAVAKCGNGKVIAAGGYGFTDAVELYDPVTGTWSAVGQLAAAVSSLSAVQLHDGRVFIMGGESWSGTHTHHSSVGIYVPGAVALTSGPQMLVGRSKFESLLLPGGDILAISGGASNANYSTTVACDRFDLTTQSWKPAPAINESRLDFAAIMTDGRVFVFGGLNFKSGVNVTLGSVEALTLSAADTDGDGLYDWWEKVTFGNLNQTPGGDPDNDNWTNVEELANKTNPMVFDIGPTGIWTAVEFGWRSVSGRKYQVQWAASPSGPWQNWGAPMAGTGSYMTILDSTRLAGQRYYKVSLAP